jgi:predicted nucleic acid-binding protein
LVPDEAVLDTSFVVHALVVSETHHAGAARFLAQLAEQGSPIIFNELLELELRQARFQAALRERWGNRWMRKRHDGRCLRRARRLTQETVMVWEELLLAFDHLRIGLDEVSDRIEELMGRFGLSSYDAVHAATAEYSTGLIVTTDATFARLPQSRLTVYVDRSRLAVCRQRRSRRP